MGSMASQRSSTAVAGLLLVLSTRVAAGIPPQALVFDPDYYPTSLNASLRTPLAKYAVTDPKLLPYQILGIVGGYVIFTGIVFIFVMTFGRRWRRSAQSSHGPVSTEMVKPSRWMPQISRHSPNKSVSSLKKWGSKGPTVTTSPVQNASFDESVHADHKARQDAQMAEIYDQIMQTDTKSPRAISIKSDEDGSSTSPRLGHTRTLSNSSRSFSQRRPPQLQSADITPTSPMQPYSHIDGNTSHSTYPSRPLQPASPRSQHSFEHTPSRQHSNASSRSRNTLGSTSSQPGAGNPDRRSKAKSTRSVRNLTISAPVNRYPGAADDDEARTPLSPRNYSNVMPPPTPPGGRPITPIQDDFEDDDDETYSETTRDVYGLNGPRAIPSVAPQRGVIYSDPSSPPPLPPPPRAEHNPAAASANTLPLRNYAPSAASSSTTVGLPASPGPTKTTMLSPRREHLTRQRDVAGHIGFAPLTGGLPTGQMTAGLGSAVPMTPLSPYMPFTPVTPITPRLTTRADRRRREREGGRRVANAEEDGVQDEKEVWGSAW